VTLLDDPAYTVPPPPPAGPVGTLSWLRATVSRFSAGPDHARRRAMIVARLATLDPAALRERARETGDATFTLAEALGASDARAAADAVAAIAPHYNPPRPTEASRAVDAAVTSLLALLPSAPPEAAAQQIAILVQSHAATAALIAAGGKIDPPPVPISRRIAPTGELVEVDLTGQPFGAGPHACPGAEHALALAAGVLVRG
jgi:cytochrome P450